MAEQTWQVAFASDDRTHVNQHFGVASGFCIHAIAPETARLIEVLHCVGAETHQDRVGERIALLEGCQLLFCVAVGDAARRQLLAAGITALVVEQGTAIASLLPKLQERPARYRGLPGQGKKPPPPSVVEDRLLAILADGWDE
ncbi:MAG: nitrogen fixation protein NifX [Magnetococcales bacterium]|nr:nitrogen fixation protein NifX [Magnetococcales bacterium]